MEEYLTLNHMTQVVPMSDGKYFLPHHAVIKESSSTTKLRVVFDASCKDIHGVSLNDHLLTGPKLQADIINTLMNWRKCKFAYTADMVKMYRQIRISANDWEYQLILWRDQHGDIKPHALKTVTFGTASAPYLAVRMLHQLSEDEKLNYPLGAKILQNHFYVDDLLYSADTLEEALDSQQQVNAILKSAGFHLRKWASNHAKILEQVPKVDRELEIPLTFDSKDAIKTLGIQWHPGKDSFSFKISVPTTNPITKRTLLSDIAKLYDPLGWISPCIVIAKIMIQELWVCKSGWDEVVNPCLQDRWTTFRKTLKEIEKIEIPRWLQLTKDTKNIQLHGICDASEKAYSAVVYMRIMNTNSKV